MRTKRIWFFLILSTALLVILISWSRLRRNIEAALVLEDIAAGTGPSWIKKLTPAPSRIPVAFRNKDRWYHGDLYRSGRSATARLLLIPGAAEEGKDDSRLVVLATTLARAGFVVLVPDMEGLKRLQVKSGDVREVVAFFQNLTELPDKASAGRCGMAAFSYALGPAVLAALSPEIRSQVDFIVGVGGYYDLPQVLMFATTGYFSENGGTWRYLPPNEYGKWLFVRSNLYRLASRKDRELLRLITVRKMDDPGAEVTNLAAGLDPEGRSIFAFVTNRDRSRAAALLSRLPSEVLNEIETLNLANKDLSTLKARLLLVHGVDDDIVPYPQSVSLAGSLPKGQAKLFPVKGLAHVDVKVSLAESWRLWRAVVALLDERDD